MQYLIQASSPAACREDRLPAIDSTISALRASLASHGGGDDDEL